VVTSRAFENFLVRSGVIDDAGLAQAKSEADRNDLDMLDVIVQLGLAGEVALYKALAEFSELKFIHPSQIDIPADVIELVPARFATHYHFVPIENRNGTLVVALSDPLNAQLVDDIRLMLKRRIDVAVATPAEIRQVIKNVYGVGADTVERILSDTEAAEGIVHLDAAPISAELGDEKIDASIIKFVNEVLLEAIRTDATDIHIEPFEEILRVRYRIDGVLHQIPTPPNIRGFHSAIVSRLKIMANLNIAEKRLPQDGKILASFGDSKYDLRVSVLPTPHGETVNIRILSRSSMFLTLEQLGCKDADLKLFNSFLRRPHGIILVTGPTGSGKTTTLYASLSKLNKLDKKTITIEDPIEYQLDGITQMQVLPRIGFDFSMGLRSMLRHDPDIMMVGEIRDYETAEMAVRASLTGHLVFSTLHTNDAAGAVTRLTDMGVEPFLIASTMIASIAQRLVRKICDNCAEVYAPSDEEFAELNVNRTSPEVGSATFRRGRGCDQCRNTGYRGRLAIYEILPFTNPIKELTVQRATSTEIKRKGRALGMKTLRDSGWARVCEGVTTFEEVLRVTSDSDVVEAIETGDAAIPVQS